MRRLRSKLGAVGAFRQATNWSILLLMSGGIWACVPEFNDETSLVEAPRLLAIRAEPAEVKPGGVVTLRALFVDENGEESGGESVDWSLCTRRKPLTELGPVAPECVLEFGTESSALEVLGMGVSVDAQVGTDVCRKFGPLSPPLEPGQTVPGRAVDPDLSGGFYQPVVAGNPDPVVGRIRASCGATGLTQAEAVLFNQAYRPNEHPEPNAITYLNGEDELPVEGAITIHAGKELIVSAHFPTCPSEPACGDGLCTAYENPTVCSADCSTNPIGCLGAEAYVYADQKARATTLKRETLEIGWFAASGTFEFATTDNSEAVEVVRNTWVAPESATETRLWLVARDDRGGSSWRSVRVRVVVP